MVRDSHNRRKFRLLGRILRILLPRYLSRQINNFVTLSLRYGQLPSMKKWSCIDGNGNPIPWYTYPATEYLANLDFSEKKVLEYGSGNSSLWWADRCKNIISVEDDRSWYDKISVKGGKFENFDYRFEVDIARYVRQEELPHSDIVIIDGKHRAACVDFFIDQYSSGAVRTSVLIFDNSDWYPNVVERLKRDLDWVQVDFSGFGPINDYTWTTTVFINPESRPRLNYIRKLGSVSGLSHNAEDDV